MNDVNQYNFLPVVEKAAIAVYSSIGQYNKHHSDDLATQAMRKELSRMDISSTVIIGEGEMDEAPMLYIGEKLGKGGLEIDIAVDPLEGTNLTAKTQNNAITVIALSSQNSFLEAPDMYMKKICVGKNFMGQVDIQKSLSENIKNYIKATGKTPENIKVAMLDRERHYEYMQEVISLGCRLILLSDGDVLPGICTAIDDVDIDILYGIGAAPEGVITAAALKALGGNFQGVLVPVDEEQKQRCISMGIEDPENHVFTLHELVKKEDIQVVLSAVTDGFIGKGVTKKDSHYIVHSLKISSAEPKVQYIKSIYEV